MSALAAAEADGGRRRQAGLRGWREGQFLAAAQLHMASGLLPATHPATPWQPACRPALALVSRRFRGLLFSPAVPEAWRLFGISPGRNKLRRCVGGRSVC